MGLDKAAVKTAIDVYGEDAQEFVQLTLKDADAFVEEIAAEMKRGDVLSAALAAHSLKSVMRQIGAEDVGSVAYGIEMAGKAGQADVCMAQLQPLREAYTEVREYLTALT